jgi:hypothetical protein
MSDNSTTPVEPDSQAARREFLKRCGRFAAVTPPAMVMMLEVAAATPSEARASTIGWGNGQGGNNNHQGGSYTVTGKP